MGDLLEKIGLVRYDRIEIPVEKKMFVQALAKNLDDPHYNMFDAFSKDRRLYKGVVDEEGFRMWKRKRLLDTRFTIARATGVISDNGNYIQIDLRLTGVSPMLIRGFLFGGFFYIVAIALMMMNRKAPGWVVPVIMGHGLLMASIPLVGIKKSLEHARYDLERDLYHMMRDVMNTDRT